MINSTTAYPVFLTLSGRQCAVVGLGGVGRRKLAGLLAADVGSVLVFDSRSPDRLSPEAAAALKNPRVKFEARQFGEADAVASFLVFAATSSAEENLRVADICRRNGVLCNCVSDPGAGTFILPATARMGSLCAALSTSGDSPFLAQQWRLELEDWLKPRERLAWLMGRLRGPVLALGHESAHNSMIFRKIAESPIPKWLERNEIENCRQWLQAELPPELNQELTLIFSEYVDVFA